MVSVRSIPIKLQYPFVPNTIECPFDARRQRASRRSNRARPAGGCLRWDASMSSEMRLAHLHKRRKPSREPRMAILDDHHAADPFEGNDFVQGRLHIVDGFDKED